MKMKRLSEQVTMTTSVSERVLVVEAKKQKRNGIWEKASSPGAFMSVSC